MPTNNYVGTLKINELTTAQYNAAVQSDVISDDDLSFLTDALDEQQTTMPTAEAKYEGQIVQFVGTTDANYTHGYFYECVSDGQPTPTYSWSNIQVQASSGGLPSQTGNAGTVLTTDGTNASWGGELDHLNFADGGSWKYKFGYANVDGYRCFGLIDSNNISACMWNSNQQALVSNKTLPTIGTSGKKWSNVYTTKINNGADIAVPTVAGSMAVQVSTIPTASSTLEGQIYQYIGATDSTYTNGRFYKCVSDGGNPATYSWTEVQLGGGGSSYTAGTGIDITSGVISVTSPTLTNTATGTNALTVGGTAATSARATNVGVGSVAYTDGVAIGNGAQGGSNGFSGGRNATGADNTISIGALTRVTANYAIQLNASGSAATNSSANTFKVANANGNFEMMSADGTIPHARLTNAVSSTSVTIATTDWSSNTASVTVSGLTATSVVWVAPDNASQSTYTTAGVYASSQSADTLVFSCSQTPASSLTINIVWC